DYIDEPMEIAPGSHSESSVRLFAGAKELTLLDHYAGGGKELGAPIRLFDRALDFGSFYFLAKPATLITYYLYKSTGNFGVALLIFVMLLKIVMYPLASKSYKSMAQMRELQPEMVKIREKYFDDQIAMHKATRELYKREKVNPAAGCLPVLLQIIIFLALFRGLNVMIEMRHAPFFGWIRDLSAADPSNLFTGFGLLPWSPPSFLHLGLLPIIYCITMVIQTSLQPKPPDPVQAKMITYMPYFMLIFFQSMPSGFVLYWTWSNTLSIFQQQMITKKHKKPAAPVGAGANV
ncbi:MAG: membrane protein insertase YidC, partial [Proteobacteria bacterium]|nr:membrane protein insertase YidC [Pseudomonadota bacterium]